MTRHDYPSRTSVTLTAAGALAATCSAFGGGLVCDSTTCPAVGHEKIVFAARFDGATETDIYMVNPDGSGLKNLTADWGGDAYGPQISPDGKHIAFSSTPGGAHQQVHVMSADGSGKTVLTGFNDVSGPSSSAWLSETEILFLRGPATCQGDIWVVDIETQDTSLFLASSDFGQGAIAVELTASCTQSTIACAAQSGCSSPTWDIYLACLDGSNPTAFYEDSPDNSHSRPVFLGCDGNVYWAQNVNMGTGNDDEAIVRKALDSPLPVDQYDSIVRDADGVRMTPRAMSPDCSTLLVAPSSTSDGLYLLDLASGTETLLIGGDQVSGQASWGYLAADPARKKGDANGDGCVNIQDLIDVILGWDNTCP